DTEVRFADLQRESLTAIEGDQRVVEPTECAADAILPQRRRGQPRLADDTIGLAAPHIEVQRGAAQNPAPLAARAMGFDEEGFAVEGPRRGHIVVRLLTRLLESVQLLS